jgi:hypothetical protein
LIYNDEEGDMGTHLGSWTAIIMMAPSVDDTQLTTLTGVIWGYTWFHGLGYILKVISVC